MTLEEDHLLGPPARTRDRGRDDIGHRPIDALPAPGAGDRHVGTKRAALARDADAFERRVELVAQPDQRFRIGQSQCEDAGSGKDECRAVDPKRERLLVRRRSSDGLADPRDQRPRRRPKEAKRDVEGLGREPPKARSDRGRQLLGGRRDAFSDGRRHRNRDEESGGALAGRVRQADSKVPRSSASTRRASRSSRHPITSTALSSSSL